MIRVKQVHVKHIHHARSSSTLKTGLLAYEHVATLVFSLFQGAARCTDVVVEVY